MYYYDKGKKHTNDHLPITHALLHTHIPTLLLVSIFIIILVPTFRLLTFVRSCDRLARDGRVVAILLQPGHGFGRCIVTGSLFGREELVAAAKGDAVDARICLRIVILSTGFVAAAAAALLAALADERLAAEACAEHVLLEDGVRGAGLAAEFCIVRVIG